MQPKKVNEIPDLTSITDRLTGGQLLEDLGRLHTNSIVLYGSDKYKCTGHAYYSPSLDSKFLTVYHESLDEYVIPMDSIDSKFPEVGYYNILLKEDPSFSILIERKLERRNWRLGFNPCNALLSIPYLNNNSNLYKCIAETVFKKVLTTTNLRTPLSSALYMAVSGKYHKFSTALASIRGGRRYSVAMTSRMVIASSPYRNEVGIFLLGTKVAVVNADNSITILATWAEDSIKEVCDA